MSFTTFILATYETADEAKDAAEAMTLAADITRRGRQLHIVVPYMTGSKYGAVRPASEALFNVFDPVALDDYYRPWPVSLDLRVTWVAE